MKQKNPERGGADIFFRKTAHSDRLLGRAILGLRTEEEAEVIIDGQSRTVIIEAIRQVA